jgi:hypothetical protein
MVNPTDMTFNGTDSELNGVDELAAILLPNAFNSANLCSDLGDAGCSPSDTTSTGDVTDINTLLTDLGGTLLGEETDPNSLSSLAFNQTLTADQEGQVVLVAEGRPGAEIDPATRSRPRAANGADLRPAALAHDAVRLGRLRRVAWRELARRPCAPLLGRFSAYLDAI